mgnify:CR=1 FL=1
MSRTNTTGEGEMKNLLIVTNPIPLQFCRNKSPRVYNNVACEFIFLSHHLIIMSQIAKGRYYKSVSYRY